MDSILLEETNLPVELCNLCCEFIAPDVVEIGDNHNYHYYNGELFTKNDFAELLHIVTGYENHLVLVTVEPLAGSSHVWFIDLNKWHKGDPLPALRCVDFVESAFCNPDGIYLQHVRGDADVYSYSYEYIGHRRMRFAGAQLAEHRDSRYLRRMIVDLRNDRLTCLMPDMDKPHMLVVGHNTCIVREGGRIDVWHGKEHVARFKMDGPIRKDLACFGFTYDSDHITFNCCTYSVCVHR